MYGWGVEGEIHRVEFLMHVEEKERFLLIEFSSLNSQDYLRREDFIPSINHPEYPSRIYLADEGKRDV